MLNEKQQQAKNLYFQTDFTKTQIADMLSVSRRSLHYWIRENNWERLKRSATHLPAMLAENCYLIIAQFTNAILSENRIKRPVTVQEADTLHKLALTVRKLKNHNTLNESMEMFGHFMERVNKTSPELADQLMPFVSDYMEERAAINPAAFMPAKLNEQGFIPVEQEDNTELQKDIADIMAWEHEAGNINTIDIEQLHSMDKHLEPTPSVPQDPSAPSNEVDRVEATPEGSHNTSPVPNEVIREQVPRAARPSLNDLHKASQAYAESQVRAGNMSWMEAIDYVSEEEATRRKEIIAEAELNILKGTRRSAA